SASMHAITCSFHRECALPWNSLHAGLPERGGQDLVGPQRNSQTLWPRCLLRVNTHMRVAPTRRDRRVLSQRPRSLCRNALLPSMTNNRRRPGPLAIGTGTAGVQTTGDLGERLGILFLPDGGAGFIGLELVENLVRRGITTTLVELQDQVLPPFDKEMTTPIAEHLAAKGVSLLLGQSAEAFEQAPEGLVVRLKSGQRLPAQLVVL